jgi:hypothetical protein
MVDLHSNSIQHAYTSIHRVTLALVLGLATATTSRLRLAERPTGFVEVGLRAPTAGEVIAVTAALEA